MKMVLFIALYISSDNIEIFYPSKSASNKSKSLICNDRWTCVMWKFEKNSYYSGEKILVLDKRDDVFRTFNGFT